MDEHDDQPEDRSSAEPVTERVRIVGAEPAAVLAGEERPPEEAEPEAPGRREAHYLGFVHQATAPPPPPPPPPAPAGDGGTLAAVPPELPHWADPPTGQVPAVIDRRAEESDEDAAWAAFADSGPVWREHEHEWEDTGGFEPAMLADDETRVGALDEAPVEERRPWEFDDLTPPGATRAVQKEESSAGSTAAPGYEDVSDTHSVTAEHDLVGTPEPGGGSQTVPAPAPLQRDLPVDEGALSRSAAPSNGLLDPAPTAVESALSAPGRPRPGGEPAEAGRSTLSAPAAVAERAPAPPHAPIVSARERRRRHAGRGGTPPSGTETASGRRNVPVAVATGVGLAAVGLICFAAGPLATLVLATVVVALAAAETYASLRRVGMRPATLLGLVATVAVMVSAYSKGVAALPLVMVLVVITSMLWYLVGADRSSPVEGITATVLGFAWVGLLGSFAALILAPSIYPHRHGVAFLLGAVVATVGADVGALVFGSLLGRHQLAPHVSPNKTWEGWVGGAVLSVAASMLITGHVHPWTPSKAAILGAVVAVVAPLGDLCESLVKRDLGLKDMGSLLPGHGGVLDRVDAMLFVLPATYYLVRVLNLG